MRPIFHTALGFLMVVSVAGAQQAGKWQKITAPEGFAVLLPGTPTRTADNPRSTRYTLSQENRQFSVAVQAVAQNVAPGVEVDVLLLKGCYGVIKVVDGKVIGSIRVIVLDDKHPGREFLMVKKDERSHVRVRVYWANQRLHVMIVEGSQAVVNGSDAAKFLDSLVVGK